LSGALAKMKDGTHSSLDGTDVNRRFSFRNGFS